MKFHLYLLKGSANVKISVQCFENFGGTNAPNVPPLVARLVRALPVKKYHIKLLKKVWYIILVLCT